MAKIAIVTGGGRGIGRGIAVAFAQRAFIVVVHFGRNRSAAESVIREITVGGGSAFSLEAELSSFEAVSRFYRALDGELRSRTGSNAFDVLVNNAGIASPASYREITFEQYEHLFAVNVRAPFFLTQLAIPRIRDGGRIINISSLASRHASPSPITVPYSMTKAALDALTLGAAQDLGSRQITVNTIAPGAVTTDINKQYLNDAAIRKGIEAQTALHRIGTVEDIANIACFLASPESQWMTGEYIHAGGGYRL